MMDRNLAELYGVETRALNQAVKRNIERFPEEFMFQLNKREMEIWISQIVISKREKMGLRRAPLVFTEPGVAMLFSVLNSKKAIQVNIQIIKTFIKLREMIATNILFYDFKANMKTIYDSICLENIIIPRISDWDRRRLELCNASNSGFCDDLIK